MKNSHIKKTLFSRHVLTWKESSVITLRKITASFLWQKNSNEEDDLFSAPHAHLEDFVTPHCMAKSLLTFLQRKIHTTKRMFFFCTTRHSLTWKALGCSPCRATRECRNPPTSGRLAGRLRFHRHPHHAGIVAHPPRTPPTAWRSEKAADINQR